MLLAIDIGNTQIVIGVFEGDRLRTHWRVSTHPVRTPDEYAVLILDLFRADQMSHRGIEAVICSSVVPPLTPTFVKLGEKYFNAKPIFVSHEMDTGLTIRLENPREIGADRLVNAAAGYALYGGPLIIVDFGTATTLCAISRNAEYLGGVIAPGVTIAAEALFSRAAKLPKIDLAAPKSVIGRETVASMQAGILIGFACMVDGLIERVQAEMQETPRVVATGGLAGLILPQTKRIQEVNPFLTLEGLRILYTRNRG